MFLLSSVMFGFMVFDWHGALPMSIAMALGAHDVYKYALRLIRRFHLRADEMVTGKFDVGSTKVGS